MPEIPEIVSQKEIEKILALDKNVTKVDESTKRWIVSIDAVSASLKKAGITIKDVNKAQKANETSSKKLTQIEKEQLAAEKALETQRRRGLAQMAKLEAKEKDLTAAIKKEVKSEDDLIRKTNALVAVRRKLDVSTEKGRKAHARLTREIDKNTRALKRSDAAIGRNQRNVGKYSTALRGAATSLMGALGLTAGLFGFIMVMRNVISTSIKFEKQAATLAGVLDVEKSAVTALTNQAIKLGGIYPTLASEVLDLQTAFARLGFTQQEILDLTEDTILGTFALNSGLEETALLVGAVVKVFDDLSATDAGEIIDKLTKSTQRSSLNFEGLKTALPKVAGAANALNIPLSKILALLGTAADATQDFSIAGTSLRRIMLADAKAGRDLSEGLDIIEASTNKVKVATELYGNRAAVVALALVNQREKTAELTIEIEKSAGVAERTAKKQLDTLKGSLDGVASAWEKFTLTVNQSRGVLKFFADNVTSAINTLTDASISLPGISDGFGKFVARLLGFSVKEANEATARVSKLFKDLKKLSVDELKTRIEEQKGLIAAFIADGNTLQAKQESFFLISMEKQLKVAEDVAAKKVEADKDAADDIQKLIDEEFASEEEFRDKIAELTRSDLEKKLAALDKEVEAAREAGISEVLIAEFVKTKKGIILEEHTRKVQIEVDKQNKIRQKAYDEDIKERQKTADEALKIEFFLEKDEEVDPSLDPKVQAMAKRNAAIVKLAQKLADKEIEIREITNEEISTLLSAGVIDFGEAQALKTQSLELEAEREKEIRDALGDAAIEATRALFDIRGAFIERELQRVRDRHAFELSLAGDNADARAKINAKFEKKERELARKKAVNDKLRALFEVTLATAVAIAEASPNVPLMIIAAVLGAIQTAVVLATPIPQFYAGTENAPKGVISFAERGQEMVQTKSGQMFLATQPTIASGLEGAKIYTNKETERILSSKNTGYDSPDLRELINGNKQIVKAIKNIPRVTRDKDNRSITEREGNYFKTYLNTKVGSW